MGPCLRFFENSIFLVAAGDSAAAMDFTLGFEGLGL